MSTVISSTTEYATQADFLIRFDARTTADLLSDTGTRVDPSLLGANQTLKYLLKEASGLVEAACLKGDRYTPADLKQLTVLVLGNTTNAYEMLKGIVCGLVAWTLFDRRPDKRQSMPLKAQWAIDMLEALATGQRIFGFQETADAGLAEHHVETPQDVTDRNLVD